MSAGAVLQESRVAVSAPSSQLSRARHLAWACAGVTALIVLRIWVSAMGVYHDEAAYLLQAKIYAGGHWTADARPLPEFFEQFHVFVTPFFAAKYFPGQSLLLVPGVWLNHPNLVPVFLSGLSGGLLFALTRRVLSTPVALIAWVLWITSWGSLAHLASYMSEVTTGALWLLGWWALLEWRRTRNRWWLLALALSTGWQAITRPLTAVAFAFPVAIVVGFDLWRRRAWTDLASAMALCLAILAVLPLWNHQTTGDWRRSPYSLYTEWYFPYDRLGFGFDSTPPRRPGSPDMLQLTAELAPVHRAHTLSRIPVTLVERLRFVGRDMWAGTRIVLLPVALLGLAGSPAPLLFALGTGLLLVLFYLGYGHPAFWSIYYLEAQPALAAVTATGFWMIGGALAGALARRRPRSTPAQPKPSSLRWAPTILFIILGSGVARRVEQARADRTEQLASKLAFHSAAGRISGRGIVFVRSAPGHDIHRSLVENEPDLAGSRLWVVHDRGAENAKLMELAPDRSAYVYDERRNILTPWSAASLVTGQ